MAYVALLRVSTQRQGDSGLGIEAQAQAVQRHAELVGHPIIATFTEIESGTVKDRPELAAALALCRQKRATLLIARLDRLSRSLSFIAQLLESNVEITAADVPSANRMMLQMLAVFAEHERSLISARTKAALAAAKARGVKLGANGAVLARAREAEALAHAVAVSPLVEEARRDGATTCRAMAAWLNAREMPTRAGGRWSAAGVSRLIRRLGGPASAPASEAMARGPYPGDFSPGTLLGPFHHVCTQRFGTAQEIMSTASAQELRALLDYANRYHHDSNPAHATVLINDAELADFTRRTLAFIRRP